ncbi:MAG: ABC transporter permease [Myxococcota bacterium]|nr:ABC transporter permease [Myxococcota bacterium]
MKSELLRTLWKNRLARVGFVVVVGLILAAIFAPFLARQDPNDCKLSSELASMSGLYWMGADPDGCDIYSRVIYGARISLKVGVSVVAISASIGIFIGLLSGYFGGRLDRALMFVLECFQAFPGILLAITITALSPTRSINLVILALCVSGWVGYARLVRGQTLLVREQEYVTAARALGMGSFRIMFTQILPNLLSPVIVQATFGMAGAILAEAGLSFLGLGAPPGEPSWGSMLNEGRDYMLVAPHISVFPGVAIMVVVLGFNFLGDGLRDALDPKRRGR